MKLNAEQKKLVDRWAAGEVAEMITSDWGEPFKDADQNMPLSLSQHDDLSAAAWDYFGIAIKNLAKELRARARGK